MFDFATKLVFGFMCRLPGRWLVLEHAIQTTYGLDSTDGILSCFETMLLFSQLTVFTYVYRFEPRLNNLGMVCPCLEAIKSRYYTV